MGAGFFSKKPTANPEAYELYLKARFFWNKRTGNDLKTAADYFQRAIDADPSYANAYAGLAQSYLLIPVFGAGAPRDFFPKAMVAAHRAIKLDETSAEGHSALAMLVLFDFKFKESEEEFRRAIELNPNYATAHHWFGNSLLVTLGRFDEAIKEGERAVELDPLSLIINADLGSTLMIARRYDEAIAQLRTEFAFLGIHRANQHKPRSVMMRHSLPFDPIDAAARNIQQRIDQTIGQQIHFVDVQHATVRFGQ